MKTALIRPLCEDKAEFAEPLGLEALAGYLLQKNIPCQIFDRVLMKLEKKDFYTEFDMYDPSLIALSITSDDELGDALRLIQLLKNPERQFVVGGHWVTTARSAARAALPGFVVQVYGEGEQALITLAQDGARLTENIPLLDPDQWAFAFRPDLQTYLKYNKAVSLRTARGCPGKCSFCSTAALPDYMHHYAARSLGLVVDEIEVLAARCVQYGQWPIFHFVDDAFGPLERIEELIRILKARKLNIAFSLEIRAAALTRTAFVKKQWQDWHEAGLCRIFVGLESFDLSVLHRWNKPVIIPLLLEVIQGLRTIPIEVETGYILWHRDSTRQQIFEEIDLLHDHGLLTPKAALSRLIIYPGTALYGQYGLTGEAVPEPLAPEVEGLYHEMEERLYPLYELWKQGAVWLPQWAALAHLTGNNHPLQQLKALLKMINEKTYHRVYSPPADISSFYHTMQDELKRLSVHFEGYGALV